MTSTHGRRFVCIEDSMQSNSTFSRRQTRWRQVRDYVTIPKGRGYVYAYENHLYNRVKTEGRTKYWKCNVSVCDGSAKPISPLLYFPHPHFLPCRFVHSRKFHSRLLQLVLARCINTAADDQPFISYFQHYSSRLL